MTSVPPCRRPIACPPCLISLGCDEHHRPRLRRCIGATGKRWRAVMDGRQGEVTTNDGVRLRYRETGSGQPLVLVHGWSQAAALFQYQLDGLSDRYRVIAYDQRGHGESDKPAFGYRIARLAKDLHDFLVALDLHDVAVLGHSLGCSVLWAYWDLFGAERLAKLILVDQPPFLTRNPAWSSEELEQIGAL